MSGSRPSWPKLAGLGCLGLTALVVLAAGVSYIFIQVAGTRDIASLQRLERTLPGPDAYTPTGAVPADRLRRFLSVRRSLAPHCAEFGAAAAAFVGMEDLAADEKEPSPRAFLLGAGRAARGLGMMARQAGRHLETRNQALLAVGMGLGEFTWIQAVAYHGWLAQPATRFPLSRPEEPRVFQGRVVPQVREMIRRLVAAREAATEAAGTPAADLEPWRRELAALEADPERVPFAEGVPAELAASLEPFRAELQELWCAATCEVDLTITEREGIGFEHR